MNDNNRQFSKTISRRTLIASIGAIGAGITAAGLGLQSGIKHAEENNSLGLVTTTIAALRQRKDPRQETLFLVTDSGKEGYFVYDPDMDSKEDDGDTVIVGIGGSRFIRLTRHNRSGSLESYDYASMNESYESMIDTSKDEYSYEAMITHINQLCEAYPERLQKEIIGRSVLGRDIPAVILGNRKSPNRLFVMASSHAREYHGTPIIMKQIEFYIRNWNRCYNGEPVSRIFQNAAIYYVPMHNPDGVALTQQGFGSIPLFQQDRYIPLIKEAVQTKIRDHLAVSDDLDAGWNLGVSDRRQYMFREKELIVWKSNLNGVDLHYNFYEGGVNKQEFLDYIQTAKADWWARSFATEDYRGEDGFSEPETAAVRGFIEKYGLTKYAITYHGRGPTIFWNYRQPYKSYIRDKEIALDLADLTKSPCSATNSLPIGFVGWYIQKYGGFCANLEIGWSRFPIDPETMQLIPGNPADACPLKQEQYPLIWKAQKFTMLHLLQKYVAGSANETVIHLPQPNHFNYDAYWRNMLASRNALGKLSTVSDLIDKISNVGGVDVNEFGADPTGRIDSTRAFREAFYSGKIVRADGTFLLTDTLTLRDYFVLQGSGIGKTKLVMQQGIDKPIFNIYGSFITIENVEIAYLDNNASLKTNQTAIRFYTNWSCSFRNIAISKCYTGLYLGTGTTHTVSHCSFENVSISTYKQSAIQLIGRTPNLHNRFKNIRISNFLSKPSNDFTGKALGSILHLENFVCGTLDHVHISETEITTHAVQILNSPLVRLSAIGISGIKASTAEEERALLFLSNSSVSVEGLSIQDIALNTTPSSFAFYPVSVRSGSTLELRQVECENARTIVQGRYGYFLDCSSDSRYEYSGVSLTRKHNNETMKLTAAPDYTSRNYPQVSTLERNRIAGVFPGMYVHDTDLDRIVVWNGSGWVNKDGSPL